MRWKEKNLLQNYAATLKKFSAQGAKKVEYGKYNLLASEMDGWVTCDFTPFSTVFQSYQDYGRMIMKDCVQWNPVYGWKDFRLEQGSSPGRYISRQALSLLSESGSFRSYSRSVRSFRPGSFRPDFWGESFRPSWGGSFRPISWVGRFGPFFGVSRFGLIYL